MYDAEVISGKIKKDGLDSVIKDLSSENLSPETKEELTSLQILIDGYPNISLLLRLATM